MEQALGEILGLTFPMALTLMKNERNVTIGREGRPGEKIGVHFPDRDGRFTDRFLFVVSAKGETMPWTPSSQDLFAEDWKIVS